MPLCAGSIPAPPANKEVNMLRIIAITVFIMIGIGEIALVAICHKLEKDYEIRIVGYHHNRSDMDGQVKEKE